MELVFVGCLQKYIGGIDRCGDYDGKRKRGTGGGKHVGKRF
jgi:hypothetical protein